MVSMFRAVLTGLLLLCAPIAVRAAAAEQPAPAETPAFTDRQALTAAVRDLCGKDVALLGEATHGDGRTVAFKVELVQQLVRRCGYNAVFFEADQYDFLAFQRKLRQGEAVSPEMVSAAIGGIWKFDQELAPLVPFLFSEAKAGRIRLGGIDDQLGIAGVLYANDDMPDELTGYLQGGEKAECRALMKRLTYFNSFETEADRPRFHRCVADMAHNISAARLDPATRAELLQMLAGIERAAARYGMDMASNIAGRDRSMYLSFRSLADRLPPRSKIIVWGATAHMAKDAAVSGDYSKGPNFGAFVHQAYGKRAFALGFSAGGGSNYYSRKEPARALLAAPPDSVEARALAGGGADAVYLGHARLTELGAAPAGAFSHRFVPAAWSEVLDGLVVFREERPPHRMDLATSSRGT